MRAPRTSEAPIDREPVIGDRPLPIHGLRRGIAVVIAAALAVNLFTAYYLGHERCVYFWDYAVFWLKFQELGGILNAPWSLALKSIRDSVWFEDYNLLAVLPLLPLRSAFGDGRATYIFGIVNILLLPGIVMLAVAARAMIRCTAADRRMFVFGAAVLVSLTSHVWWIPTLRGFPDVEGVFLIGMLLWLNFRRPLHRQHLASLCLTGVLLFLMVAMRRWYAFWVVTMFPALLIAQAFENEPRTIDWRRFAWLSIRNVGVIGLTSLATLFLLAKPFAIRALTVDYGDVHSAYRTADPFRGGLALATNYLGPALVIFSVSGLGLLMVCASTRRAGVFLFVQTVLMLLLFLPVQWIDIDHYFLFAPTITLGLVALATLGPGRVAPAWTRLLVTLSIVGLLSLGSFKALVPPGRDLPAWLATALTKAKAQPMTRNDILELDRLIATLQDLEAEAEGRIYVLASSTTLNSHLLQVHCRMREAPCDLDGKIASTHDIDKRDGFPSELLKARFVLVADPIQYHLNSKDQTVVGLPAQEFFDGSGISSAFRRLPQEFRLDGNVRVYVFAKTRELEAQDLTILSNRFKSLYPDHQSIFRVDL